MTVPPLTGREGAGYLPQFAECATYRSRGSAGGAGENKMCARPEPFEKTEKKQSPTESPHFFLFHSLLCCCRPLCVCAVETHGFLKARGNGELGVGTGWGWRAREGREDPCAQCPAGPSAFPPAGEHSPSPRTSLDARAQREGNRLPSPPQNCPRPWIPQVASPSLSFLLGDVGAPSSHGMKRRQSRPPTVAAVRARQGGLSRERSGGSSSEGGARGS